MVTDIGHGIRGIADIVSYFFLRAAQLSHAFGFLAVNTIAQGDTRAVGLEWLTSNGWTIARATRSREWPGEAGVHISQVWLTKGTIQSTVLDDVEVQDISSLLRSGRETTARPSVLAANADLSYIGSYALGMGFTMTEIEAQTLIAKDQANRDVLFPYLNGEDLCTNPDGAPSRWIINFFDWPEERARGYADCFRIVELKVKPQRDRVNDAGGRKYWWRFLRTRRELYSAIRQSPQVVAIPRISKIATPLSYQPGIVFAESVVVFPCADSGIYALLTSTIHRDWARRFSSSLKADILYAPSDCFETFPLPESFGDCGSLMDEIDRLRRTYMQTQNIGMTKVYNRIKDASRQDDSLAALRGLHVGLDRSICDAYGWSDIDLGYDFHETEESVRWTMSATAREQVLGRLLELNRKRHADEVAAGTAPAAGRPAKKGRPAKRAAIENLSFFPEA